MLGVSEAVYYVYTRLRQLTLGVQEIGEAEFLVKLAPDSDPHLFLTALVSSANAEGKREVVSTHGFTEILPGQIRTDRIVSANGQSYLDLNGNHMHLGSEEEYMDYKDGKLTLSKAWVRNKLTVLDEATSGKSFYVDNEEVHITSKLRDGIKPFYAYVPVPAPEKKQEAENSARDIRVSYKLYMSDPQRFHKASFRSVFNYCELLYEHCNNEDFKRMAKRIIDAAPANRDFENMKLQERRDFNNTISRELYMHMEYLDVANEIFISQVYCNYSIASELTFGTDGYITIDTRYENKRGDGFKYLDQAPKDVPSFKNSVIKIGDGDIVKKEEGKKDKELFKNVK